MSNSTIDYYNKHAIEYFETTVNADMSAICDRFLKYIQPGGKILDVGCGSGRDLKYFIEAGYSAEGIDLSSELCKIASNYSGAKVICADIRNWRPTEKYDGVWANASLLHLRHEEIENVILRLPKFLKENGIAYISLKEGIKTGNDERGRYFSNFTATSAQQILHKKNSIQLIECWNTEDGLHRNEFHWINLLLMNSQIINA